MTIILNYCYKIVPNYGVAIILLTVLIKLILAPLTYKQTKSMGEMQKIQPLIKEIQEKYKDDPKKMQQETMALYKEYHINPIGGCLPLLVQLPFLFALYRMLWHYPNLKNAGFLWIKDLTSPDVILVLLLGLTTYLSQKTMITDEKQAKMMAFMPIMIMIMFWKLSSGLVLYIIVSNIFTTIQQYFLLKGQKKIIK